MTRKMPTKEQLHKILIYCPESGIFRWKIKKSKNRKVFLNGN